VTNSFLDFLDRARHRFPSCRRRIRGSRPANLAAQTTIRASRDACSECVGDFLDALDGEDIAGWLLVNLYAPCDVPIAIASASHWVFFTKSAACSTSVSNCSRVMVAFGAVAVFLVALHGFERASTPSSASTVTPME